ncbi:hypothetical protein WISP_118081 [Willisornis vidua]|uniref:Reverse transcriptase domain-containing protein n=1 Tax=Willisornis vidua TaxID=1566151 RepID=A0ABQ9CTB5_9PASS|nr:hypothetical protein WISP_118081 [Willisornis vidua]
METSFNKAKCKILNLGQDHPWYQYCPGDEEIDSSAEKGLEILVTQLVDEGRAVDLVYVDFSKASDTVSHNMPLEKLAAHGLDRALRAG